MDAAEVSVSLDDDDLLALHVLARLGGVDDDDAGGFADVVRLTLHHGALERFDAAGLAWPPAPDALEMARQVSAEDATPAEDRASGRAGSPAIRNLAIAALGAAAIVAIVGGYGAHWSWTGLEANNQLWDWLNLLLLPVAIGTFPIWLRLADRMDRVHRRALAAAVLGFGALVAVGYLAPWNWTGFRGQTLWNWLTLVVLPISVMLAAAWHGAGRELRRIHVVGLASVAVGLTVTVIGGYAGHWAWTGYPGNTLWDWLLLLLAPVALNTIAVPLIRLVSGDVEARAAAEERRAQREKALSAARGRAGIIA